MSQSIRTLHVAAAQVHSNNGPQETLISIDRQVAAASIQGAHLVLFSEAVVHGYDYGMTVDSINQLAQPTDGPDAQALLTTARNYGVIVVAGMFEKNQGKVYNSMIIARPNGELEVARKHVLTKAEQTAGLASGPRKMTVIQVQGVRCAVVICADCSIDTLHQDLRDDHVDFRLCPTGGGGSLDDILYEADLATQAGQSKYTRSRSAVFRAEAILGKEDCPYTGFASANALGPVGETNFHQGHCMIVDNQRVLRAQIPGTTIREHAQDQIICAKLNFY